MKAKYLVLLALTPLILVIDQLTKLYIDGSMKLYESIPVIDGLFSITYLRNRGAAFSFLSDASWRLPFFCSPQSLPLLRFWWLSKSCAMTSALRLSP